MSQQPPQQAPKSRDEKDEKDEKEREKDEKSREEKWRRDPLGAIAWAAILIWAGVVFLVSNLDLLPRFAGWRLEVWPLIFLGAGCIVLLEALLRLIMPQYRRGIVGSVIVGFVFLAIGGGNSVGWEMIWPVALIAAGVAILIGGIFRR